MKIRKAKNANKRLANRIADFEMTASKPNFDRGSMHRPGSQNPHKTHFKDDRR